MLRKRLHNITLLFPFAALFAAIFAALLAACSTPGFCQDPRDRTAAKLESLPPPSPLLKQLEWKTTTLTVHASKDPSEPPFVRVEGNFRRKTWDLMAFARGEAGTISTKTSPRISMSPTQNLERTVLLEIPLTGETTMVELIAVSPKGIRESAQYQVRFNGWGFSAPPPAQESRVQLTPSAGYTYLVYRETGMSDLVLHALTAKASVNFRLSPNWIAGLSSYLTALPLSSNLDRASPRFFGVNARVGYLLPFPAKPWKLTLWAGWYYATMFGTEAAFGYRHMGGPQLYPVLQREWSTLGTLGGYLKFSPMASGVSLLALSNHELAGGLFWIRSLSNGHPLSLALDAASLRFRLGRSQVSSTSFSLSAGYGF